MSDQYDYICGQSPEPTMFYLWNDRWVAGKWVVTTQDGMSPKATSFRCGYDRDVLQQEADEKNSWISIRV